MTSIFVLGFVMGIRHAFEADHLAAMATLAGRGRSTRSSILQGAAWGLGHTLTLLLIGGTCLLVGAAVPERWANRLELVVGLMLLALGADTLRRMHRARLHAHLHQHADGRSHWHLHQHPSTREEDSAAHEHPHRHREAFPARAMAVGLVHGLAGSAALFLLALQTVGTFWRGLAYIALFGLGSVVGMAILTAAVAVPLRVAAVRMARVRRVMEAAVGVATLAIGVRLICRLLA